MKCLHLPSPRNHEVNDFAHLWVKALFHAVKHTIPVQPPAEPPPPPLDTPLAPR